jgi:hypothetical protein
MYAITESPVRSAALADASAGNVRDCRFALSFAM